MEAKQSEKKNTEAKWSVKKNLGSEKIDGKFSLKYAKRKWNESRFASFVFALKGNRRTLMCTHLG
jgi:hypothetical protein